MPKSNTPQSMKCFEDCENILANEPILLYPDSSKAFISTTDSSNFDISAILSQGTIEKDKSVAYALGTVNQSEQNKSTTVQ
ncbi:hypothetical protein JTB14_024511 [Gonioctena quinquepunctata]|nr:hypothetical protein JTB14_024511 [Gonioctena quinquepunctata]